MVDSIDSSGRPGKARVTGVSRRFESVWGLAVLGALLVAANGCGRSRERAPVRSTSPGSSEAIAVVGKRVLGKSELLMLRQRTSLDTERFVERWATDSLLAEAARDGALHPGRVHQVERAVLARVLLKSISEAAEKRGELTEQELDLVRAERWFEVNRPAAVQTTHFVVLDNKGEKRASAEALANTLAAAVSAAKNPREFIDIVVNHPKAGLEVVAESLPPVTADGRSLQVAPDGRVIGAGPAFDKTFARAANSLSEPGDRSRLVHSEFGFHVILLERKMPAFREPDEVLRQRYASDMYIRRARGATEKAIEDARQVTSVVVENSFQEAVAQLQAAL